MALPVFLALTLLSSLSLIGPAGAQDAVMQVSRAPFAQVAQAMEQSIAEYKMGLVCHANAQRAAAGRGVTIRGNQVMMVFRPDFAVRLLAADPKAGFEAPIRIYLYENADGTTTVAYRTPSAVFARYPHPEVRAVASELDPIFKAIVDRARATR
jgi:uncharacterized protein (DUF302 family)